MKYAVIVSGGKQYKVSEGDVITVDKLLGDKNDKINFDEVLLMVDEGNVKIGKPVVSGVKVAGELVEQIKGDKIRVSKFKAKSRYRRTVGFRALLTQIKIDKIEAGKAESKEKPSKTTKKK